LVILHKSENRFKEEKGQSGGNRKSQI